MGINRRIKPISHPSAGMVETLLQRHLKAEESKIMQQAFTRMLAALE
jgi:hypothetical protein